LMRISSLSCSERSSSARKWLMCSSTSAFLRGQHRTQHTHRAAEIGALTADSNGHTARLAA
jgi:hypothetical protein